MTIGYDNIRLKSIRERETGPGQTTPSGKLPVSTALRNVSYTFDLLLAHIDHGQQTGDCSEAVKDINHMILRLEAIKAAL